MIGAGPVVLTEALGDLFRRPVGDDGVDQLVASWPRYVGVGET